MYNVVRFLYVQSVVCKSDNFFSLGFFSAFGRTDKECKDSFTSRKNKADCLSRVNGVLRVMKKMRVMKKDASDDKNASNKKDASDEKRCE